MKQVYILLSRTGTIPSRLIYKMTSGAFTHTSFSLLPETDRFYSYARRKINNPFCAGLIEENIHTEVFARYPNCHCSLFSLTVSDEGYERIRKELDLYWKNYARATYNFLGILPIRLGIPVHRKFKLTCSQFVALMLNASGDIELPKDPYVMLPNDFLKIKNIKKLYEGRLSKCTFPSVAKAKAPALS